MNGEDRPPTDSGIWSRPYLPVTLANVIVVALVAFDALAVVAALPSMAEDLGFVVLLPWVVTAYVATSAVAGIVAGPLIDAIGPRRTFQLTGLWFIVANAAGAAVPSMPLLIVARVVQGVGGGLLFAVAVSSIGLAYPPKLRARAFAANSLVWGVLGLSSPAFAGALLATASWRSVFAVPIPFTALALAVGWRSLPVTKEAPERIRMDWRGTAILAGLLGSSLLAVGQIGVRWWGVAFAAAAAAALGTVYWWYSGQVDRAVLAREHLARLPLRWIHVTAGLALMAGLAVNNYLPLYVQTTRGRSVEYGAVSLVFLSVGWTIGSVTYSTLLAKRRESDVILVGASLLVPSIGVAGIGIAFDGALTVIFAAFGVIGLALGFISTASLTLVQAMSEPFEIGRVNAAHQFATTLGLTYGVALGGAVVLLVVSREVGDVETIRSAVAGDHPALGTETNEAIGRGLAWAIATAGAFSIGALLAATRLARHCTRAMRSSEPERADQIATGRSHPSLIGS